MEERIRQIFGEGDHLAPLQMCVRAIIISIICLIFIRFSGRRSFGLGTPLDNVLAILLGAVMSRAVVGASPFASVVVAGAAIVCLHRLLAWFGQFSSRFGSLVKGETKVVYEHGKFITENMRYCRVTENDLMVGVRLSIHENSLDNVKAVYVERNGRISVIKKDPGNEKGNGRTAG
jgi:uncharacterized membrane protein YcaP (DUF421 family)